jgi:hypothetical protein
VDRGAKQRPIEPDTHNASRLLPSQRRAFTGPRRVSPFCVSRDLAWRQDRIAAPTSADKPATKEITAMLSPKSYRTIEDFQREELRAHDKAGFSLDDLMQETMLHASDLLFDDQVDELDPEEE